MTQQTTVRDTNIFIVLYWKGC